MRPYERPPRQDAMESPMREPGLRPVERVTDTMETPSLDDRTYRVIRLSNQLEVLLVHDADTDKASASMDVNVGNFSDEDDMPGMAHAVEHLLFMGTKKYPAENAYSQYLSTHSGSSNAYTGMTSTNFFFDVAGKPSDDGEASETNPSPLYGALDRFAQFFIEPLFLASTLDRELRAVDSENKKNLQNDQWRFHQLEKSLSNPKHPYCHFSTGNLDVLKVQPESKGINVRDKFIEFYTKHYSANLMKLVVLGREPLDVLEKWVSDLFSDIPNKSLEQNRWSDEVPFGPEQLSMQCFTKPVMESRELNLFFPFLDEEYEFESQPSRYISHLIGHEGPGSIMSYIKSKGWANTLSAGAYPVCPGTPGIFDCQIRLTEEGLKNYKEVVKVFFQYVSLLRETRPLQWIFEEQKGLADVDFKFKQKTPASRFTSNISSVMQKPLPREWLLSGHSRIRKFDPELIKKGIDMLRPDNFRMTVVSRDFPGRWDKKEKWYGTEYSYGKIPADFMEEIKKAASMPAQQRIPKLHLPHKNQFIPTKLNVEKTCLSPDTMVRTTKGFKAIRDIAIGDQLFDHQDNPVQCLAAEAIQTSPDMKKVIYTEYNSVKKTSFTCTSDHIMTLRAHRVTPGVYDSGLRVRWYTRCDRTELKRGAEELKRGAEELKWDTVMHDLYTEVSQERGRRPTDGEVRQYLSAITRKQVVLDSEDESSGVEGVKDGPQSPALIKLLDKLKDMGVDLEDTDASMIRMLLQQHMEEYLEALVPEPEEVPDDDNDDLIIDLDAPRMRKFASITLSTSSPPSDPTYRNTTEAAPSSPFQGPASGVGPESQQPESQSAHESQATSYASTIVKDDAMDKFAALRDQLSKPHLNRKCKNANCKGIREQTAIFKNKEQAELALKLLSGDHYRVVDPCAVQDMELFAMTMEEYLATCTAQKTQKLRKLRLYRAPLRFVPYQGPVSPVSIDPYWLGLWLGDGSKTVPEIAGSDQEIKVYIQAYVNRLNSEKPDGAAPLRFAERISHAAGSASTIAGKPATATKDCFWWRISSSVSSGSALWNPIIAGLKDLDLLGDKSGGIPDCYMDADEDTRLAVLAGLIDSDGHLNKITNGYMFSQTTYEHRKIVEDAHKLAISCGIHCGNIIQFSKPGATGPSWRFYMGKGTEKFQHHLLLPGKRLDMSSIIRKTRVVRTFDVEDAGQGEYRLIEVSGGLYQLADRTVVHNCSSEEPAIAPRIIRNDDTARTWWKKDDTFWVPKATVVVSCQTPLVFATAQNSVKARVYTDLVRDALEEYSYDAELAGLQYSVSLDSRGLFIEVSGYNDKLPVLLEQVLVTMRDLKIKQDRFDINKERLSRAYRNWAFQQPYHQLGDYTSWLTAENDFVMEELVAELPSITAEGTRAFHKEILAQLHLEVYVHGNLYKEDALKLTDLIVSTLKPRVLPRAQWPILRSLIYPAGSNYSFERTLKDPENVNHAIEYVLYVGDKADRVLRAKTLLLDQFTHEPAFDQLRTKEQLGYVVFSGVRGTATTYSFRFIIQSEKTPSFLEARIESFLISFGETLAEMSAADFESQKRSLINKRLEKLKNLDQETSRHWNQIHTQYYDFDFAQQDAAAVRQLTKTDMIEFFKRYIDPTSEARAKLVVHLLAQAKSDVSTREISELIKTLSLDAELARQAATDLQARLTSAHHDHAKELEGLKGYLLRDLGVAEDKIEAVAAKWEKISKEHGSGGNGNGTNGVGGEKSGGDGDGDGDGAGAGVGKDGVVSFNGTTPTVIDDVRDLKCRLLTTGGATPVRDLSEYEDFDSKL